MPQIPRYTLADLMKEAEELGPLSQPEFVDWGPDRGAEIIDDAYSRNELTIECPQEPASVEENWKDEEMNQVLVSRWGNSLAIRLPKRIAEALNLTEGKPVTVTANGDVLEIRAKPVPALKYHNRDELIRQIDPNNVPESFDDGPVGRELL